MGRNSWLPIKNINSWSFWIWKKQLLNLINNQPDVAKIYPIDPDEAKYQFLINKIENIGIKYFNDSKAFIEYSHDMDDIYKDIEDYNPIQKGKNIDRTW